MVRSLVKKTLEKGPCVISDEQCRWHLRKRTRGFIARMSKYVVVTSLSLLLSAGIALAGPTGFSTDGGSSYSQNGTMHTITQTDQVSRVYWKSYSSAANETINYIQPNATAISINKITGTDPSILAGALNANGRVFILNKAGILFTGTSRVNVAGLIATTADDVAIDGTKFTFSGKEYGQVINQGQIHVSEGGFAVLAAPYVGNTGTIQANLGQIQLVSTNNITADFRGDGLITFTVPDDTVNAMEVEGKKLGVDNSGTLTAKSGLITISAALASDIVKSVVNLSGVMDADAFGSGKDGGTVLISSRGDINNNSRISADGGVEGNGGTIITKADGANAFEADGSMTARGGTSAGNGGFIELSGTDFVWDGAINAAAPHGKAGTFLLDPATIIIRNGPGTNSTTGSIVYERNIENTSQGGTSVNLSAEFAITMNDLADNELTGGAGSITFTLAQGGIIKFIDNNDKITTTNGNITMIAPDGPINDFANPLGTINIGYLQTTNGGSIALRSGIGGVTTRNLSTVGDNAPVTIISTGGSVKINTGATFTQVGNITTGLITTSGNGSGVTITTQTTDPTLPGGNVTTKAIATSGNNAGVTITTVPLAGITVDSASTKGLSSTIQMSAGAGGITTGTLSTGAAGLGASNPGTITMTTTNGGSITTADISAITSNTANATTELTINASGNLTTTGDITLSAQGDNSAVAKAELSAGNDLSFIGDAQVLGTAENGTAVDARSSFIARAEHDLFFKGDTTMRAEAHGTNTSTANASSRITAGHNATIETDPVTLTAKAGNTGAGSTNANADLYIAADTGDLFIRGDVWSKAEIEAARNASADANLTLTALGKVTNLYGSTYPAAPIPPSAFALPARAQSPATLSTNFSKSDAATTAQGTFSASLNITGGSVLVEPKYTLPTPPPKDPTVDVISTYEIKERPEFFPGRDPLRIASGGLALWATGAGITAPSSSIALTPDIESAILAGADPTTLLPAPAAGSTGLSAGLDAFSTGGLDFCDQVVKGSCLPSLERKEKK